MQKNAGPSDGKNDKVSPAFRLPVLASLARPLAVPPYHFLPASHNSGHTVSHSAHFPVHLQSSFIEISYFKV
jgi:hypothetical protein